MQRIHVGLSEKEEKKIVSELSKLLADTFSLYLQTHNFHWNVTGPLFHNLHLLFEGQYNELFQAVDVIAERIRTLGFHAPGSLSLYKKLSSIQETDKVPEALQMVKYLVKNHETIITRVRALLPLVEKAHDQATVEMLIHRLSAHEKMAWMLRSLLEKSY